MQPVAHAARVFGFTVFRAVVSSVDMDNAASTRTLTMDERRRYGRHLLVPGIGEDGQAALLSSRVLVIGAGGLGASCLSYLAACGIGTIGIMDDDSVELSNLNRQIIHETGDIGRRKVDSAQDRLEELNPGIRVHTYPQRFTEASISLPGAYDLVIDGSDNFETRYRLNTACRHIATPWLYCAVRGWEAQHSCFNLGEADEPCYRCLVPAPPGHTQDCAEHGIVGALVGVMGSLLALEAVKYLAGSGTLYHRRLLRYDALHGRWREATLSRDPSCKECGDDL